jgi:hypothetical protein
MYEERSQVFVAALCHGIGCGDPAFMVAGMKKKGTRIPRSRVPAPKKVMLPPVQPVDVSVKKALKLERFGPNIEITVPLHLLPAYIDIYHLVPMTLDEVRDAEKRLGKRKPAGMLWVKRVPRTTAILKEN